MLDINSNLVLYITLSFLCSVLLTCNFFFLFYSEAADVQAETKKVGKGTLSKRDSKKAVPKKVLTPGSFGHALVHGEGSSNDGKKRPSTNPAEPKKRTSSTPADTSTPSKKTRDTGSRTHVIFEDEDNEDDFVETSVQAFKEAKAQAKIKAKAEAKKRREAEIDKLFEYKDDDLSASFIAAETQRAIDIITGKS